MPSGLWTPRQKQMVTSNYVRAYMSASPEQRRMGAEFYPGWNEDATHIGEHIGRTLEHGAALMAHLSPANEAEQNRIQALQLTHTDFTSRQVRNVLAAGEAASRHTGAISNRTHAMKRGDTAAASHWNEEAERHAADVAKLRSKSGIGADTPLSSLGSREVANAMRVREGIGEHGSDPMGSLGHLKLRDFGGLIHDPTGYNRAPIDTHYHDVGVNRIDIPYAQSRGLGSVGRYEHFQGAHERARGIVQSRLGLEIPHGEFMGGAWYHQQQRKVYGNPDAMRARRASETKIGNIRASRAAQPYLPERFGLRPMFGKIDTGV